MKRRVLIGVVIGVNVLATVACVSMLTEHVASGSLVEASVSAGAVGQASLLAIWIALGGRGTAWRFAGVIAALACCTLLLEAAPRHCEARGWGYLLFPQVIGSSVPLLLVRFLGLEVTRTGLADAALQPFRLQFSLRSMLEWTAAVAVLCSMIQIMSEEFRSIFVSTDCCKPVTIFAVYGGLAAASLWLAMGARWLIARLVFLGLMGATFGVVVRQFNVSSPVSALAAFLVAEILWVTASLFPFRLLGYRLVWRRSVPL